MKVDLNSRLRAKDDQIDEKNGKKKYSHINKVKKIVISIGMFFKIFFRQFSNLIYLSLNTFCRNKLKLMQIATHFRFDGQEKKKCNALSSSSVCLYLFI